MNNVIEMMLAKYQPQTEQNKENAIKEIVQEIVLAGLSHGGFFDKAVFYGGTCLRIFHHLDRFSEDLDFALLTQDQSFNIEDYFPNVKKELLAYGLDMSIVRKNKKEEMVSVQSAFIKGNTQILLLEFFPQSNAHNANKNQIIKIKFEIDIDNPSGGVVETKYRLLPAPYEIKIYDESTLFAGKIHAIICRDYKNRVKGRDYYDYLFYCAKQTKINMLYLENKLKNSSVISLNETLNIELLKKLLRAKFSSVNYDLAKNDVINFVKNKDSLKIWNKELFLSTLDELK